MFTTTTDPAGTDYRLIYVVTDPSGVAQTRVHKEGEVKHEASFLVGHRPGRTTRDVSFHTGLVDTGIDSLTGTTVDVTATDAHGNTRRTVGLERTNFYGRVAGEFDTGLESLVAAEVLGVTSGFAASLGSSADVIKQFAEDPLGVVESLKQLVALLDRIGLLGPLVDAFFAEFADKQRRANPYEPGTKRNTTFKYSWYAGYVAGFASTAALGSAATKALKSTKAFGKVEDFVSASRPGRAFARVRAPADAARVRTAARILDGADRAAAPVVTRAKSVGATYRLWRLQRRVDGDVCGAGASVAVDCDGLFDDLSDEDGAVVARTLLRNREASRIVLRNLETDAQREEFVDLIRRGELDGADVDAMGRMLQGQEFVDPAVTANDLLEIARKGADLSEIRIVVRPKNSPEIKWLEGGKPKEGGWKHVSARHIRGTVDVNEKGGTSFFPMGQETISDLPLPAELSGKGLPDTVTEKTLKEMIFTGIKRGEATQNGRKFFFRPSEEGFPDSGIDRMRITLSEDGSIETAFPVSGERVWRWVPELNDGNGGWVHAD